MLIPQLWVICEGVGIMVTAIPSVFNIFSPSIALWVLLNTIMK